MSLNDTAAVEVMGYRKENLRTFDLSDVQWIDKSNMVVTFKPDSSYTDAMLVRDKAVERTMNHFDVDETTAQFRFYSELKAVFGEENDVRSWKLLFASPAQITEASIALVRRMK